MAEGRAREQLAQTAAGPLPAGPRRWALALPCGALITANRLGTHWGPRHRLIRQIQDDTMNHVVRTAFLRGPLIQCPRNRARHVHFRLTLTEIVLPQLPDQATIGGAR